MDEVYGGLRPLLFSIAYRMVGSVSEAEDIVQEAFLRFHRTLEGGERVGSAKAYLSTVTTRLAIDHLRSARVQRERYVGAWLPEPLLTEGEDDAARHAETADTLSMAFLVILESLSPVERAVFLLRDVFEYDYAEIARIVGKSEENARQLASRARRRVEAGRPRFEASREKREELARSFLAAIEDGDMERLVGMLAADAVAVGDGGGKAAAIPRPLQGREAVARFLMGLRRLAVRKGSTVRLGEANGQPALLAFDADGRIVTVMSLDIANGTVHALRSVVNPDKLRHIPVER